MSTTDNAGERPLPRIISVDDHVVEPAHVWQERLPAKHREAGPRIVRRGIASMTYRGGTNYDIVWDDDADPVDVWLYEDIAFPHKRHTAAVGFPRDEMSLGGITYDDMRPGCYDAKARAADMAANHVEKSLCFPTFPRFCGQTFTEAKDRELGLLCIKAYNDWMVDEWCTESEGVNVPLTIIPLWDPSLAAAEVQRNAARGVTAVCFSEIPAKLGLPSIHEPGYWDPFFAACADTGTVVCMHIGSSSQMPATSPDAPPAVSITLSFNNAMASMSDFLFSGILVRYPELKLAYSEGQIGWIPYILERADDVWVEHRAWGGVADKIPEPPSTYYYRQIYGCFFRDRHGLESIGTVGVDNITFETDYPHTDSTWPDTAKLAREMFADLDDDAVYKICRGNAIEMLGLDLD
ncbi:MAG TPA: amidohydrolase family protein [Acidimicrobiales bacterium]